MNRPQRNNNPINLRYAHQDGTAGQDDDGFAMFSTPIAGWRGAHKQIQIDQGRDLTLQEFIFKFAPPNENNTNAYLDFVRTQLNVSKDLKLSSINKYALAGIMAQYEGYYEMP